MLFNSPLSSEKAKMLIELLDLNSSSRVIDVGCGTGEFLMRIVERYRAQGIGVDIDQSALEDARKSAELKGCGALARFVETDIHDYQVDLPFDCGVCLGSSHAYAMNEPAYLETLRGLGQSVKVGGILLIGESFWIRQPESEYLEFIGEPVGTYREHHENVELAESCGMRALYATTSSLDEWDDFEWRHHMRIEKRALENPECEATLQKRDRGRAWRSAYLRWGRGTMGFGFYLFRREH